MTKTLLRTKLFIPPPRPNLVPRPRLIEQLNQGIHLGHNLTLISAPAGFGKTTLASEWLASLNTGSAEEGQIRHRRSEAATSEIRNQIAWLSLDEGDNDPTRFLAYLVAALQTLAPEIGDGAMAMLQSPQPPPTESILTTLLNDITAVPQRQPIILVLDDYHLIDARPVDEALTFLLQHLPPNMHLAIATREDPNLPLARLRARGQLTELRVADLRFTPDEAAAFLNQAMGLTLSADEIAALEKRTEGWITGLQLAALSMQGRADTTTFIQTFTGSHQFILDYLIEEVLQHYPEHVRDFLLDTSILDRLSGPLCDAVRFEETPSSSTGTAKMLQTLEHGNMFVIPLDDSRQWYRYHHLFADVLQAHLKEEQPARLPILHRRASVWYEQNGSPSAAIRHALAATDFERAAGLIELARPEMESGFQSAIWLGWVQALPDEMIRARPVLCAGYGWALLDVGQMEASEARLLDAERLLDRAAGTPEHPPAEIVVVDQEQFQTLPSSIATARAYRAMVFGDVSGTVEHAQQALDLLPKGDHLWHRAATSLLGLAQYWNGDLQAAHMFLSDLMADMQETGNIQDAISLTFLLAEISTTLGRLHEAANIYQHSLQLALSQGEPLLLGTSDLYRGLSELYREWGDLQTAAQHLQSGEELGKQAPPTDWPYRLSVTQGRMKEAQGDLDGALTLFNEAERQSVRNPLPVVHPIGALKARVWVKQGRLTQALAWVREQGLSADDELNYLREFEHITLTRILIAAYKNGGQERIIQEAQELLARLLGAAQERGRTGSAIEIQILQALTHEAQGDIPRALIPLERALTLAKPQGYIQTFINEGPPMARLLQAAARGAAQSYARQLLTAFPAPESEQIDSSKIKSDFRHPASQIVDPLSRRELEVLRLLATELSGPEIARELMVSLNTMRTHTKNIYSKLGVNNRRSAVRRAEELSLL